MTFEEFLRIPLGFLELEKPNCRDEAADFLAELSGLSERDVFEFVVLDAFAVLSAMLNWLTTHEPKFADEAVDNMTAHVVVRLLEHFPEFVNMDNAWPVLEKRLNGYIEAYSTEGGAGGSELGELFVRMTGQPRDEMASPAGSAAMETIEIVYQEINRMVKTRIIPSELRPVSGAAVTQYLSSAEGP